MPARGFVEKMRDLDTSELQARERELAEQIFRLRFQLTSGQAEAVGRLRLAQSAADTFGPHGGHWDALPHEANPNDYDTYAASIALLAVITARRAGLGWDDSAHSKKPARI